MCQMVDFPRRRFLQTALATAALGVRPGLALARQGQVRTIAGTGVAGYAR